MILVNPTLCIPSHNLLHRDIGNQSAIISFGAVALAFPFLHPDTCAALVDESEHHAELFVPNEAEEPEYRMAELVLAGHCPSLYLSLLTLQREALAPWVQRVTNMRAPINRSLQIARYSHGEQGSSHFDEDSDLTFVTKLEDVAMLDDVDTSFDLAAPVHAEVLSYDLPVGYALVFCGKMQMHRGGKVLGKQRHILVSWNETK